MRFGNVHILSIVMTIVCSGLRTNLCLKVEEVWQEHCDVATDSSGLHMNLCLKMEEVWPEHLDVATGSRSPYIITSMKMGPQQFDDLVDYLRKCYLNRLNETESLLKASFKKFKKIMKNSANEIVEFSGYQEILEARRVRDNNLSEYVKSIKYLKNETLNKTNIEICIISDFTYYLSIALKKCTFGQEISRENEPTASSFLSSFMKDNINKYVKEKTEALECMDEKLEMMAPMKERKETLRLEKQRFVIRKRAKTRPRELRCMEGRIKALELIDKSLESVTNFSTFFQDRELEGLFNEGRKSLEAIHNYVDLIDGCQECTSAHFTAIRPLCRNSREQATFINKKLKKSKSAEIIKNDKLFLNGKRCIFKTCHLHICNNADH